MARSPYDPSGRDFDPGPRPRLQCGCGVTFVREVASQWQCRPCVGGYGSQPDGSSEGRQKLRVFDGGERRFPPVVAERSEEVNRLNLLSTEWSESEKRTLQRVFRFAPRAEVLAALPGRSWGACKEQARRMVIERRVTSAQERKAEVAQNRRLYALPPDASAWDGLVLEPAGEGGS